MLQSFVLEPRAALKPHFSWRHEALVFWMSHSALLEWDNSGRCLGASTAATWSQNSQALTSNADVPLLSERASRLAWKRARSSASRQTTRNSSKNTKLLILITLKLCWSSTTGAPWFSSDRSSSLTLFFRTLQGKPIEALLQTATNVCTTVRRREDGVKMLMA